MQKNKPQQSGFTLLELLIVVILVALVASLAMVSLNTARNKGRDASIAGNLATVRQYAESYHLDDGHYNRVCGANGAEQSEQVAKIISSAEAESPSGEAGATCATPVAGNANGWAISLPLATSGFWCVDASGFSGRIGDDLSHPNDLECQ